jgi:hypothetical protein
MLAELFVILSLKSLAIQKDTKIKVRQQILKILFLNSTVDTTAWCRTTECTFCVEPTPRNCLFMTCMQHSECLKLVSLKNTNFTFSLLCLCSQEQCNEDRQMEQRTVLQSSALPVVFNGGTVQGFFTILYCTEVVHSGMQRRDSTGYFACAMVIRYNINPDPNGWRHKSIKKLQIYIFVYITD